MTFLKGHCRFIKQHNEHYNHHHSEMFSSLPGKNIIYRPNKNNTTLSASCRDLPSKHISPFSYYSWHCLLILHSCPAASLFLFLWSPSSIPRPRPCNLLYHTHTVQVSHWCLIWNWWCDLAAHGYNALLWLEPSCWWNTNLCYSLSIRLSAKLWQYYWHLF